MTAKEFLREAFWSGALDVTDSYETVEKFVRLFKGEREAGYAILLCHFLNDHQKQTLQDLASCQT